MSTRRNIKLDYWKRFRRNYLKGIYLIDLMSSIQNESLFILTTKQLIGDLSEYDKKRYLQLCRWYKWLKRIKKGQWPWGFNEKLKSSIRIGGTS